MAVLETGDLTLPTKLIGPWLEKVQTGSAVAALVNSAPMTYGTETAMTFSLGEAEYVGEGANKSSTDFTSTTKTTKPYKFQITARMTEEVLWADEDEQLQVVQGILNDAQPAVSRALDFGVFHGINPADGATVAAMTEKLSDTTNSVEIAAQEQYEIIDAADLLVLNGQYSPRDIAVDTSYAGVYTTDRTSEGIKRYPDFRIDTEVSTLEGHRASVSRTVGAIGTAAAATNIKAFVGDFSTIRWGVQRRIGMEQIRFGDPDGQGDLKRNNQVAFRLEILYGWGIFDLDAVAKIVDAA